MSNKRSVSIEYRRSIKTLRRAQKATSGLVDHRFVTAEKYNQKQEQYR